MLEALLIALVLLSKCQGFEEISYCEVTDYDVNCSGFAVNDDSEFQNVHLKSQSLHLNENLFNKFPRAKRLFISSNKISLEATIGSKTREILELVARTEVFTHYKKSASLKVLTSLKSLDIQGHLPELDEHLLAKNRNLESLAIKNSKLQVIAPKAFGNLWELSKIDLSRNLLTAKSLVNNLFKSQTKLTCLNLSGNKIKFVPMEDYWPSSLVNLDLSSNLITTITKNHFKNLIHLASVDLSYNRIDVLSRDAFMSNTNLIFASIRSNRVNKIQEKLFPDQKKLVHFDASLNKLEELKGFEGAPGIQHLNASHNELASMNDSFNMSTVTLDFSFNKIKALAFPTVDSLRFVYLNSNNIPSSEITKRKLSGVKNIEELHLNNNDIFWIYEDAFDDLEKLEIVNYSHY